MAIQLRDPLPPSQRTTRRRPLATSSAVALAAPQAVAAPRPAWRTPSPIWVQLRDRLTPAAHTNTRKLDAVGRRLSAICTLMVLGLSLWLVVSLMQDGMVWAQNQFDTLRYGYPRTDQVDAYMANASAPSHIVALNLRGQIILTIYPASDPTHLTVIRGPQLLGPAADLVPVTVQAQPNPATATPDLVVQVDSQRLIYRWLPARGGYALTP